MEIYEATGIIIIAMSLLYYKLSKEIENQGTIRSTQLRMMEEGLRDAGSFIDIGTKEPGFQSEDSGMGDANESAVRYSDARRRTSPKAQWELWRRLHP